MLNRFERSGWLNTSEMHLKVRTQRSTLRRARCVMINPANQTLEKKHL
jgi:hypothetical protein